RHAKRGRAQRIDTPHVPAYPVCATVSLGLPQSPPQHTLVCSSSLVSCRRLHPLVRQELVLSRSVLDLDAACTQRASLGIVLDMDTAERGAIDATRHLFVRIRSSRWRLQRSRVSRTPGDTSQFFGQKDAIGVCNIICTRWTRCKPTTRACLQTITITVLRQ